MIKSLQLRHCLVNSKVAENATRLNNCLFIRNRVSDAYGHYLIGIANLAIAISVCPMSHSI